MTDKIIPFPNSYPSEQRIQMARALLEDLRYQYSQDPLATQDDSGAIRAILNHDEQVLKLERDWK